MASINIDYNCGCGFKTKSLEAATEHCDAAKHAFTVLGTIRPEEAVSKEAPTIMRGTSFTALRSKLRG